MFRKTVIFLLILPVFFSVKAMDEKPWVIVVDEKDNVIYFNQNHYSNSSLDLEKSIEALYPNGFHLSHTNRDAVGMVIANNTVKFEENSVEEIFFEIKPFEIKPTDNPNIEVNEKKTKEDLKKLNLTFVMCSILGLSLGMWYGSVRKTHFGT